MTEQATSQGERAAALALAPGAAELVTTSSRWKGKDVHITDPVLVWIEKQLSLGGSTHSPA